MSKQLPNQNDPSLQTLVGQLRELIRDARSNALRSVDAIQVRTCWEIGRHIVEFEQGGATRAEYGKRLLPRLAESLTAEFGRGFDATNLRHMRGFFLAFPIRDALRRELSWTHYRLLLRVDNNEARQWYVNEAVAQNWSSRALDRQIGTLYFERLLLSGDKASVAAEADAMIAALPQTPREFVRDPVMLEFLGLPGTGKLLESKLETAHLPVAWIDTAQTGSVAVVSMDDTQQRLTAEQAIRVAIGSLTAQHTLWSQRQRRMEVWQLAWRSGQARGVG